MSYLETPTGLAVITMGYDAPVQVPNITMVVALKDGVALKHDNTTTFDNDYAGDLVLCLTRNGTVINTHYGSRFTNPLYTVTQSPSANFYQKGPPEALQRIKDVEKFLADQKGRITPQYIFEQMMTEAAQHIKFGHAVYNGNCNLQLADIMQ